MLSRYRVNRLGNLSPPRSPRGLIVSGIVVVGAGLALGWNWLTALGFAPLILSLAPCAAMCALGVCMMARGNAPKMPPAAPAREPSRQSTE
jgi:hypothetical protein